MSKELMLLWLLGVVAGFSFAMALVSEGIIK
jgi:hypothetical protein